MPWPRRIRRRVPKILRRPARERRHFIKNKFREGAVGYPGASRGFDAADSLPYSLSLCTSSCFTHAASLFPFLYTYVRPSIIRRMVLVCLAIALPMFFISLFYFLYIAEEIRGSAGYTEYNCVHRSSYILIDVYRHCVSRREILSQSRHRETFSICISLH